MNSEQDETGSVPEVHVNLEQILTRVRHAIITHITRSKRLKVHAWPYFSSG